MNRQTSTIGGVALAVVVLSVLAYTWLRTPQGPADTPAVPITGAERAEQARNVIAEIQRARAAEEQAQPPPAAAPAPEPATRQAGAGAGAGSPAPQPAAATGAASDLDTAFEQAEAFQRAGQLADAQLLYFFGARAGHAPSAFALATMNDPNHHSPETSLLPDPDAFQAYRWYSVARDKGLPGAAERLEALHEWAVAAADAGNAKAEQLLLQWE
jgi:hypothetical protein